MAVRAQRKTSLRRDDRRRTTNDHLAVRVQPESASKAGSHAHFDHRLQREDAGQNLAARLKDGLRLVAKVVCSFADRSTVEVGEVKGIRDSAGCGESWVGGCLCDDVTPASTYDSKRVAPKLAWELCPLHSVLWLAIEVESSQRLVCDR